MTAETTSGSAAARLLELNDGILVACGLYAVAELGVADVLAGRPRPVDEVAGAVSAHPHALYRLLRMLAMHGVLTEVEPGTFALTDIGEHLRSDHPQSLRAYLRLCHLSSPVLLQTLHSTRTGDTGTERAFGESLFTYYQHNPEAGAIFNAAMADLTRLETAALLSAYDFAGARRIVDVGGGDGSLLRAILAAAPGTTGVVFDQPHVTDAARAGIEAGGLSDRGTVTSGDFFAEVPAGGDLYVLKSVIHDWPDDRAVQILRACRAAMDPAGRVLLLERIVPPGDTPHPAKMMDIAMLVVLGGRERTRDEYSALLAAAGLALERVIGTRSPLSIIEAVPAS